MVIYANSWGEEQKLIIPNNLGKCCPFKKVESNAPFLKHELCMMMSFQRIKSRKRMERKKIV